MQSEMYDFKKDLAHYRKCMTFLEGDAPIQVLCLPKKIENILLKNKLFRVYDLTFKRLVEIKFLGEKSIEIVMSRVHNFVSS